MDHGPEQAKDRIERAAISVRKANHVLLQLLPRRAFQALAAPVLTPTRY